MSTVFVHVGQCGNQVGEHLWKCIAKDGTAKQSHSFTSHDGWHRAVHIDSEPKVVKKLPKILKIREKNVITGKRGRGTNWAFGYHGLKAAGEDHLLENSVESIRKEVEKCDFYSGIVLSHSLSGGTGSGFGSRLCEALKDEYPMNYLMSVTFAPCASGESPLQHYNSLLCLATLQRLVDGVVLIRNDDVLNRLQKRLPEGQVSFAYINKVIAQTLCGLFLPTDTLATSRDVSLGLEPWELLRATCPMPSTKFLHTTHLAKSKLSWEGLVTQSLRTVHRFDVNEKPFSSLAGVLVARGDSTGSFPLALKRGLDQKIKSAWNFVPWNPFPLDVWTAFLNPLGPKEAASVTMATNSSCVTEYLHHVCERSKVMMDAGAYLHWYERYGSSKEDFQEALNVLESCQADYSSAVKLS
ncbi:hypothetical protein BaRGS_00015405 [Batillaria attramentaria]|uniref:Tubulin delta chain n=1 Tax=Batillaria attramentaria TaxID=370345 RepID=A0ABD0L1J6_9CAEN